MWVTGGLRIKERRLSGTKVGSLAGARQAAAAVYYGAFFRRSRVGELPM